MRQLSVLVPLVAIVLSGCASPVPQNASATALPEAAMSATWYEAALAREQGHDHFDLAQHHGMSTPNFLLLGHDSMATSLGGNRFVGSWGCGEAGERADGRRLAILDGFGTNAHAIADVTDPANPFKVGTITISGTSSWDDTITPDGRWAVLGITPIVRFPTLTPGTGLAIEPVRAEFTDACGATREIPLPDVAFTNGVMIFDLADPSRPKYADWFPAPSFNLHSVSAAIVEGRTFVTASTVQLVHSASYFLFLEVLDTPVGGKLSYVSAFDPLPVTVANDGHVFVPTQNGHNDVTIQKHPLDGKVYAYLAAWDAGVITLDFTIPEAPVLVANWAPPTSGLLSSSLLDDCQSWGIHTTYPLLEAWDGRHYMIAGQECPGHSELGTPAGELFILDNTDPASVTMVGRWNLPVDTGIWTTQYQASPHYVAVVGKTLLVSMYHAGLWAVDLSGDLAAPPAIGVYMPDLPSGVNNHGEFGSPATEQVNVLSNGDILLYEGASGVYVLRFDPTNPAPPALPRFRD